MTLIAHGYIFFSVIIQLLTLDYQNPKQVVHKSIRHKSLLNSLG